MQQGKRKFEEEYEVEEVAYVVTKKRKYRLKLIEKSGFILYTTKICNLWSPRTKRGCNEIRSRWRYNMEMLYGEWI